MRYFKKIISIIRIIYNKRRYNKRPIYNLVYNNINGRIYDDAIYCNIYNIYCISSDRF